MKTSSHERHAAAAVFLEGRSILLCRELGNDGFPKSGFHFPGGFLPDLDHQKSDLKELISKKYQAEIRILSPMSPIVGYQNDRTVLTLHPFICEKLSPFVFPTKNFDYRFLILSDLDTLYLDHLDRLLAEKIALYYPLLINALLPYARSPHEQSELRVYLDSLVYFKDRMPASEISDFSALCQCQIDIADLRKAYKWLLNRYDLDYNEYLDLLDFRAAKQRG